MLIDATGADPALVAAISQRFVEWLTRSGRDMLRGAFAEARYTFVLVKVRVDERYSNTVDIRIEIVPKGRGTAPEEGTYKYLTKTPPADALPGFYLDAVPTDTSLIYRGMAWEEWAFIRRTGVVQTIGDYNIGQKGLTLWGDAYNTAAYYANGFAPWPFKPGFETPGVVIAAPKQLSVGHRDHPEVPEGERATIGPLAAQHIVQAWALIPTRISIGEITASVYPGAKPRLQDAFETHHVRGPDVEVTVVSNRG